MRLFIKRRFPARRPEIAAAALGPGPAVGTTGEISRNSPGCPQPFGCVAPRRRRTCVSRTPGAGNHAGVVWKPWRGRGVSGSHALCRTWFPAPSPPSSEKGV